MQPHSPHITVRHSCTNHPTPRSPLWLMQLYYRAGGWVGGKRGGVESFSVFFKNCDLFHEVESREKKDDQEWKQYWGHDCWHGNNYGLLFSWARSKVKSIQTPTNTHTYMHKTKNQCLATLLHLFSSLYVWDIIKLTYLTVCVCVLGGSVCLCVYVRVSIFFTFFIPVCVLRQGSSWLVIVLRNITNPEHDRHHKILI